MTAERIRGKIVASKKKGLWMGGTLPLGYDRHPDPLRRELLLKEDEAETVRHIFRLYRDLGNLRLVEIEATRLGLRPKAGVTPSGRVRGTGPFTWGQIHYLLTNPVYIGRIRHKDRRYPGRHGRIIDTELWDTVQACLIAARAWPRGRSNEASQARMLTGKLRDETGDILTPTQTQRHGRRFAYYVSHRLIAGGIDPTDWRLPAATIEATLRRIVVAHLRALAERHAVLAAADGTNAANIARRAQALATEVETDPMRVGTLIEVVCLELDHVRLRLAARPISAALNVTTEALDASLLTFVSPLALRRRGVETRIIAGVVQPAPDPMLLRTLAEAHTWARSLKAGRSLTEIATTTGHSEP